MGIPCPITEYNTMFAEGNTMNPDNEMSALKAVVKEDREANIKIWDAQHARGETTRNVVELLIAQGHIEYLSVNWSRVNRLIK